MTTYKNYKKLSVSNDTIAFEIDSAAGVIALSAELVKSDKLRSFCIIRNGSGDFIRFSYDIESLMSMDKDCITFL